MTTLNPYEVPLSSSIINEPTHNDNQITASRWARFGASLIDGILILMLSLAIESVFGITYGDIEDWDGSYSQLFSNEFSWKNTYNVVMAIFCFLLLNVHFLKTSGQTIGKKILSIKVVSMSGIKPDLITLVLLRELPMRLTNLVPGILSFVTVIDALFIFGKSKRCLHDFIAKTKVVKT